MRALPLVLFAATLSTGCGRSRTDGEAAKPAPAATAPTVTAPVAAPTDAGAHRFGLAAARAALRTAVRRTSDRTPAAEPPAGLFVKTRFGQGTGERVAYESPPRAGTRRPAIIWVAGGFDWSIGASAWEEGPRENDQSAAALRPDGLVLMLPALRGNNESAGESECFLGEVDDLIAAWEHLAARPDVDPARIYLGGHSTGGTLALLAAASTDRFRAIFAFGPVADPRQYGSSNCMEDGLPEAEYVARAPIEWIKDVMTPTFVIEGKDGNAGVLPILAQTASPAVRFVTVPGADHFSVLRPGSEAVARAILADTGATPAITIDAKAIAAR